MAADPGLDQSKFEILLRLGDNCLILSHRLSEWCGHGPIIEEDLALTNVALDLIGQTRLWLDYAGEIEAKGRDADALAYRRDVWDFHNVWLVEQQNGDFADTMARQFYFDAWHKLVLQGLCASTDERIAAIAEKALLEVRYHLDRSEAWVKTLGDGTEESHQRLQRAIDRLWPYAGELFTEDEHDRKAAEAGITPSPASLRQAWTEQVSTVLKQATLSLPDDPYVHRGGKTGTHTEHLGYILADMQFLQRAYPDARW